jgi:hypothetical protein
MPSLIEVHRPQGVGLHQDFFRRYRILVDDVEVASLKEGETARVDVAPGSHAVQARIDWVRTPALHVTVRRDEAVHLVVRPSGFLSGLWQGVLKPSAYLVLERA